jgi:hypothetical protein
VRPLPIEASDAAPDRNTERHTRNIVESITIAERQFLESFSTESPHRLVELVLCGISRAFRTWTGHPALHLAMVFHGRESFLDGVDLTRTVGWISETVPLVLRPRLPLDELLDDTRRQIDAARVRGKSFGVLRHLAGDGNLVSLPEPEVSLNVKLSATRIGSSFVLDEERRISLGPENLPTTERVFLLSGGVYFLEGRLCLSWDFSTRMFREETIAAFTRACRDEILLLLRRFVPSLGL